MKNRCIALSAIFFVNIFVSFGYSENLSATGNKIEAFFDTESPSNYLNSSEKSSDSPFFLTQQEEEKYLALANNRNAFSINKSASSLPSHNVTLEEATKLIVNTHPRVAQARSAAKGEEEMIAVAKAAYYPQLRGGIGTRYDKDSTRYDKDYIHTLDLEVKQNIYDFGRTKSAVKSSEYGYLGAQAYISATNEELIYTAASTVVNIARIQKLIALAEAQVKQVSSIGKLVENRYEKGASNLSDVLQAQSRFDLVQVEVLNITSQQQSQLRALGLVIGKTNLTSATIGELPSGLNQVCSLLPEWENIPEFAIAEFEAQKAYADLNYAEAEELPSISLQGSTSRPLNASSRNGSKYETSISLNLSIPIYQGGGLSANKRASANRAQAAIAKKDEIRLEINQRLSEVQVRLQYMLQRQGLLVQQVSNLKGTKELYKKQYLELGTRSLLDLLNSEQEFHQAQVEVENNKSDIIQAQLECAFYQGKLRHFFNVSNQ